MRPDLKVCAWVSVVATVVALRSEGPVPASAAAPQGAAAAPATPRFVYRPGASGLGYQPVAPRTAQAPRAASGRSGGRVRDWTTGHSLPSGGMMNKPWLKPR